MSALLVKVLYCTEIGRATLDVVRRASNALANPQERKERSYVLAMRNL